MPFFRAGSGGESVGEMPETLELINSLSENEALCVYTSTDNSVVSWQKITLSTTDYSTGQISSDGGIILIINPLKITYDYIYIGGTRLGVLSKANDVFKYNKIASASSPKKYTVATYSDLIWVFGAYNGYAMKLNIKLSNS